MAFDKLYLSICDGWYSLLQAVKINSLFTKNYKFNVGLKNYNFRIQINTFY